jgi:hypothetical protein
VAGRETGREAGREAGWSWAAGRAPGWEGAGEGTCRKTEQAPRPSTSRLAALKAIVESRQHRSGPLVPKPAPGQPPQQPPQQPQRQSPSSPRSSPEAAVQCCPSASFARLEEHKVVGDQCLHHVVPPGVPVELVAGELARALQVDDLQGAGGRGAGRREVVCQQWARGCRKGRQDSSDRRVASHAQAASQHAAPIALETVC